MLHIEFCPHQVKWGIIHCLPYGIWHGISMQFLNVNLYRYSKCRPIVQVHDLYLFRLLCFLSLLQLQLYAYLLQSTMPTYCSLLYLPSHIQLQILGTYILQLPTQLNPTTRRLSLLLHESEAEPRTSVITIITYECSGI